MGWAGLSYHFCSLHFMILRKEVGEAAEVGSQVSSVSVYNWNYFYRSTFEVLIREDWGLYICIEPSLSSL